MTKFKIMFYLSITICLLLIYYFILSNIKIDGITTINIEDKDTIFVGEGEICSNPSIVIKCEEGLICTTEDLRINFDSQKEFGTCIKIEELKNKNNS